MKIERKYQVDQIATVLNDSLRTFRDIQEHADKLSQITNDINFVIGSMIYLFHENDYYKYLGYSTFEEFARNNFEINRRTAYYLKDIYEKIFIDNKSKNIQEGIKRIGWTKARELVNIKDMKELKKWIHKAEEISVKELKMQLKRRKHK